jgi:chemosensory pili system protein ChpA (sensor histidine kinase/response regulator)
MVLVVEDHSDTRNAVVKLLERHGYEAVGVVGGREALAYLREAMPELVLLDCQMPLMDGLDLLRAMRADARLANLPVVMFTASVSYTLREEFDHLGVQGWIAKGSTDWEEILQFAKMYAGRARA